MAGGLFPLAAAAQQLPPGCQFECQGGNWEGEPFNVCVILADPYNCDACDYPCPIPPDCLNCDPEPPGYDCLDGGGPAPVPDENLAAAKE